MPTSAPLPWLACGSFLASFLASGGKASATNTCLRRRVDGEMVRRLVRVRIEVDRHADHRVSVAVEDADRVRAVVRHVRGARRRRSRSSCRAWSGRSRLRPRSRPPPAFFEHPEQPERRAREREHSQRGQSAVQGGRARRNAPKAASRLCRRSLVSRRSSRSPSFVAPAPRSANGRFPQAQAIETRPGERRLDASSCARRSASSSRATRARPGDGSASERSATRAPGIRPSPSPATAGSGSGLERGLVSTVDGCSVDTAAELDGEQIKDLTVDVKGETLWALTGAPDKRGAIWRRSARADGGMGGTWERMGLMPDDINPMTIEVAPSRSPRAST